jgi:hypothetical protein
MPAKKTSAAVARAGDAASEVERFLAESKHPRMKEILALRKIIRGADSSIGESIKWNAPSFSTTEHFATFHLRHKTGVQLVLHMGVKPRPGAQARAAITDPESLLEWKGADRAIVTFRDMQEIEARKGALVKVLRQWITFF